MSEETREVSASTDNILYVVFHGELAFYDNWDSKYIRVFAPVVDTHIYMAGPWLAERHIPRGTTMKLRGVCPGHEALSANSHIIRLGQGTEPRPASAHFEIRLPRPHKILPGFVIDVPPGAIFIKPPTGQAGGQPCPLPFTTMDLRPVFVYRMISDKPYLDDLDNDSDDNPDDPNWGAGSGLNGYYSLHVFAEEDSILTDDDTHAAVAFGIAGQVLGVNGLSVQDKVPHPPQDCAIPGLHPSEHEFTLAERSRAFACLGKQLRRGHDQHLVWREYATGADGSATRRTNEKAQGQASCGPVGN